MQNSRLKKVRDLRKALQSGDRPSLYRLFDNLHPECSGRRWTWRWYNKEWGDACDIRRDEWIRKVAQYNIALAPPGWGNSPAWFRQSLNRKQRTREKKALNKAFRDGDLDSLMMPRHRRNANWLWW